MNLIKVVLTIIAVAAMVNVNAKDHPSSKYLIQVKDLASKFESVDKQAAFEKICEYYAASKFSKEMLLEYTNLIAQTKNNFEVISYSAELTSREERYAEIFLGIAKSAANFGNENPLFMDILTGTYLKCKDINMTLND